MLNIGVPKIIDIANPNGTPAASHAPICTA